MKPAAMKEGKLYSQQPHSGAGDFTFSRANGVQTRINEHGLIETVADNTPRLSYDLDADGNVSECPTLLLEPSRTNVQIRSEEFENIAWSKTRITVSDNNVTSPKGGLNASKLAENTSGTNAYFIDDLYSQSSGTYTFSCFLKKGTLRYAGIRALTNNFGNRHFVLLDLEDGSVASTNTLGSGVTWQYNVKDYGSGWYRLAITGSHTSGNVGILISGSNVSNPTYGGAIPNYNANGSGNFYAWGAQVEAGSYPTSYIPTEGSAEVRNQDECGVYNAESLIGQTSGTLFVDFEYLYETTSDSSTDGNIDIFTVGSTVDLSESITFDNYRASFRVYVQGSAMSIASLGLGEGTAIPNTRYKLAIRYDSGNLKAVLNGIEIGSSSNTVKFASPLDGILFSFGDGTFDNEKKVNEVSLFKGGVTDSELITLTT